MCPYPDYEEEEPDLVVQELCTNTACGSKVLTGKNSLPAAQSN